MKAYNFEPACWSADEDGLDNIDKCPLGLLSFDGQNAPELSILRGHLVSESTPMEDGGDAFALDFDKKAVFGYSNDNKYYVLRNVHGMNAIPFSRAFIQQKLQGESIIVANQRIGHNPSISELTVDLSGFSEWIRTCFSHKSYEITETGNHELKFTYAPEDAHDILLYKGDGYEVYAKHFVEQDTCKTPSAFSFKETWQLSFRMLDSEGKPLNDILGKLFEPFERLLTFCMGFPGNIEGITFTSIDPAARGQYFDLYAPGKKDKISKLAANMPLPYPEISNRFQDIADKWMNAKGYALKACDAASALLGKWDKASDVMFLLAAQSFEATSRIWDDLSKPSAEEFNQKRDRVLKSIDDKELHDWAENRLKPQKYVTPGERAKNLWLKLGNFADTVIPNSELFLKQHRVSRNGYTHVKNNSDLLTGNDLYWHARAIQVLQYGAVLLYLGFQPAEILSVFQEHDFMTSFIRKAQDMYAQVEQHDDAQ